MSESHEPLWYCVQTAPKQERITSALLRNEVGIEVFSPRVRFKRARSTGVAWVNESMFPGYVFARFDYETQHRHVRATGSVAKIVSFGDRPSPVPDQLIGELRASVADEETVEIPQDVAPGEEVRIVTGPFSGVTALVTRVLPARQRVAILLEMLGSQREVEIEARDLLPDVRHPLRRK